ncbi:MAG: hypothetical protein IKH01_08880 [Prevotella sp.]|nr:hypothetical protein [Prevotella sp.]
MKKNIFIQMAYVERHKQDGSNQKWVNILSVISSLANILASLLNILCR